jgi:DNA-binding NtrC family response regulator
MRAGCIRSSYLYIRYNVPPRHNQNRLTAGCRILVVDDESSIAELAATILRREGWKAETAFHPVDALEVFGDGSGFDLVLSDFVMPEMNGCEMAVAMRRRKPGLAVAFMSGYTDDIATCQCPLLAKPFRSADLVAHVRRVLAAIVPICTGERTVEKSSVLATA